jgi:hypothetical protein
MALRVAKIRPVLTPLPPLSLERGERGGQNGPYFSHTQRKNWPTPKQGVEPSFPAFGFRRPEPKGWTGLELKAQKLLSDFKTKRGSQPFGHFKWPGVGPIELIHGSGGPLKATFWLITFSRVRFHCPTLLPLHFFANPQPPPENRSSGSKCGKGC